MDVPFPKSLTYPFRNLNYIYSAFIKNPGISLDREFRNLSLLIHYNLVIKIINIITSRDLPLKSRDFTPKIQGNFQEGLVSMTKASINVFQMPS